MSNDGGVSTDGGDGTEARRPISAACLDEYGTATEAVVTVVSAIEGIDPRELPPLRTFLDADALDRILAPRHQDERPTVRIGFSYLDYDLVVTGDGDVSVFEPSEAERDGTTGENDAPDASRNVDTLSDASSDSDALSDSDVSSDDGE
ncbi:HalOD1 output domain-containing protein [Haloprofundus salilacus]|uniref:HalOD1 output domain-containing protein n=1 Tax=Haloprofundus salilacus TaxID=2876190 RepID=UPI001CCE1EE1|nr:HalOD1 output domain-containing protein [Haloprofundus salilacus]